MRSFAEAHVRWRKNAYVMNNNGARNAALADGRGVAKWILPWDGNCYVSKKAWQAIRDGILAEPDLRYFVVPMARMTEEMHLHGDDLRGRAVEEPQIIFRNDAEEAFDERFVYGRRSKVEMLIRLGVPGGWDNWAYLPWDPGSACRESDVERVSSVGWIIRLESGARHLEFSGDRALHLRGDARRDAVIAMLNKLDRKSVSRHLNASQLTFYDEAALDAVASKKATHLLAGQLRRDAEVALARGPYSVVEKTTLPPSGDPHDYWYPSPYWWPDPESADGLPFVRRDGQRIPGTELYAPHSERFDQARLQLLFDDTTVLALAWRIHADDRYAEHSARLIRHWFIEPDTRMNPNLRFAHVRLGHHENEGEDFGILDFRNVYYFLDAVRLIVRSGALSEIEVSALRMWMRSYLDWLEHSRQGRSQARNPSYQGTLYDLQTAAIGMFLENAGTIVKSCRQARERVHLQFDTSGAQPPEHDLEKTLHDYCFNLQGWTSLARIAAFCGDDLWSFTTSDGRGIGLALAFLFETLGQGKWPFPDIANFEEERLEPLRSDFDRHYRRSDAIGSAERLSGRAVYHPECGIAPVLDAGTKLTAGVWF